VLSSDSYEPNPGVFELDLTTMTWRRREHGDITVFPVPGAVYRDRKNPRYGTANPERSDNPFWHAMARHQWPPSRARLHFGDVAPPEPEFALGPGGDMPEHGTPEFETWMVAQIEASDRRKLVRTIDDVIWTTVREEALHVALPDGRRLLIGGEVLDFGDEYADPWLYNDIVVTHADGAIDILTYPREVFPHASDLVGVVRGADVFIFGSFHWKRHPDRSRRPVVLRLDTSSYRIEPLSAAAPPVRLNLYEGCEVRVASRVVLPIVRMDEADPVLGIAFDMETLTWSEPFPHSHPDG